jgi:hypothetical protein
VSYRKEGARPDVKRQRLVSDARLGEGCHQFRGEVQSGGRRGHGPLLARENRLVIAAVGLVGAALARDVWRQRHGSCPFEQDLDRLVARKCQGPAAVGVPLLRQGPDIACEFDRVSLAQSLGIADEGLPAPQIDALVQGRADPRRTAPPLELGGNHAGIVEDQHVSGAEQSRQIPHRAVGEWPLARHHQHARSVARTHRT